jgi:hypothetical protein
MADDSNNDFRIEISWPDIGISVTGELAHSQNPELVEEFLDHLPFRSLFVHPVAGGEIVYTWAPMVSSAPIRVKVPVNSAPLGQIRYSPGGGNKFGFQYGESTEPSLTPLLGQIVHDDLHKLKLIGRTTWETVFWRKQPLFVEVRSLAPNSLRSRPSFRDGLIPELADIYDEAVLLQSTEPDDIYRLRNGNVEGGSYNQYFSVWHMAHSQLHSFAVSILTPALRLLDELPVDQFKTTFNIMVPSTEYLGFLAFKRLHNHQLTIRRLINEANDKEEIRKALIVLMRYALRLCNWSFFHFPWYLGAFYPRAGLTGILPGRVPGFSSLPELKGESQ